MEKQSAFCPICQRDVALSFTAAPVHQGQACLPDGPEVVCLDVQPGCAADVCPLSNQARLVMIVRLARSGYQPERWEIARAQCHECGQWSELQVIDEGHLRCTACGSIMTGTVLDFFEGASSSVPGKTEPKGKEG
jgi:hypothetical protein